MLSVKTNLLAMNADRQLGINTKKNTKITEKLSSGYKINRAADDAAGLAISEKMRRQIRGLTQGAANIRDGIGYVQTAEGALNEVHDMLQRINELSVKAANGTWTEEDRSYIDSEVQALKTEMDRIFKTTSFNERKIWDYGPGEHLDLQYRVEDAVTFTSRNTATSVTGGITDANCGVLALTGSDNGYTVHADNSGVWVTWTGYDGNSYQTDTVKWDDLNISGGACSFEMSDYFGEKKAGNNLYTLNGNGEYVPVFTKTVSFSVNDEAGKDENYKNAVIKSINGSKMSSSVSVYLSVDDKDCTNIPSTTNGVTIVSPSLRYPAAYASQASNATGSYTFDAANDSFLVPSSTAGNLKAPAGDSDKWVFTFNMPGIGTVNASASSTTYHSSTLGTNDKDIWWEYYTSNGHQYTRELYGRGTYNNTGGNLGSVKNAITGAINRLKTSTAKGGSGSGYIEMTFSLTAANSFTYGKGTSNSSVGSFDLRINVSVNDTLDQVMQRVEASLNSKTVLDFSNANNDYAYIGGLSGTPAQIRIPIYPDDYEPYDDTQRFFVQAGAEAGQHIDIEYEFLSLDKIGLTDTNTLTEEAAGNAINEVKAAMEIVSKQRSDFGAFQNRLEHAYNINNNTVENTQAAESLIRDTDIADAMMEYSVNNILMQAGVSMLTQANQLPNSVLELLNT